MSKIRAKRTLRCKHCTYTWLYGGRRRFNATCPDCQRQTPIRRFAAVMEV